MQDLLDAITAAPNDDGPRLVYADWLQQQPAEADRAHGEYIALACSTARNPKRTVRLQELLARHGTAWLGPVAPLLDPGRRSWARGFLDACALSRELPAIDDALGHRTWRTLRVLQTVGSSVQLAPRLICQRETANLKGLYTSQLIVNELVESAHAPRVTELAVAPDGVPLHGLFPQLAADCFGQLRKLHLFGVSPAMLPSLRLRDVALIAVAQPRSLPLWLAALVDQRPPLAELRLVETVWPLLERTGHELILRPDAAGAWNRLEIRWSYENEPKYRDLVIYALGQLPEGAIERLSFVGPTAARFDAARWRQRITAALPGVVVE